MDSQDKTDEKIYKNCEIFHCCFLYIVVAVRHVAQSKEQFAERELVLFWKENFSYKQVKGENVEITLGFPLHDKI